MDALCREYDELRAAAPSRPARAKRHFVGHEGRLRPKDPGNPSEQHLAIALWLSRSSPHRQYRCLGFAEDLPELAAQMLPFLQEAHSRYDRPFRYYWYGHRSPETWHGRTACGSLATGCISRPGG